MSKAEGCIVPPWRHKQEWCVPVLALPLGTWLRVPNLFHVRSVQMFWLQFTGCHWGQLGLCFLWWDKEQNFPFASTAQGTAWVLLAYLQDKLLVWVHRRMQSSFTQVPAFLLSQLPLLCLGEVLNQVFLHFGEVAAGLSWVLGKLLVPNKCYLTNLLKVFAFAKSQAVPWHKCAALLTHRAWQPSAAKDC